jgi:hypothetical protein
MENGVPRSLARRDRRDAASARRPVDDGSVQWGKSPCTWIGRPSSPYKSSRFGVNAELIDIPLGPLACLAQHAYRRSVLSPPPRRVPKERMLPRRVLMSPAEAEVVRRSFARRQIGILGLSAVTLVGFLVAISVGQWTLLLTVVFIVFASALVVGSIFVWRCPRCGEPFGRNWLVTECPHCFAKLTKPKQSSRPSA